MQVKYYVKQQPTNVKAGHWFCVSQGYTDEMEANRIAAWHRRTSPQKGYKTKISTVAGDEYP